MRVFLEFITDRSDGVEIINHRKVFNVSCVGVRKTRSRFGRYKTFAPVALDIIVLLFDINLFTIGT